MQNSAPKHATREIKQNLIKRGIIVIFWPLLFPDLNPIKRVWHIIKNYFQNNYPKIMSYNKLRATIKNAWEKVGKAEFKELVNNIKARCQAIINARRLFTKY